MKIAFGLNQLSEKPILLEALHIEKCVIIQNVSNSPEIDKNIIDIKLPVRIKQISDSHISEVFNKLEQLISNNHKIISKICTREEYETTKKSCIDIFGSAHLPSANIAEALYHHNEQCLHTIHNMYEHLSSMHISLSGTINDLLNSEREV